MYKKMYINLNVTLQDLCLYEYIHMICKLELVSLSGPWVEKQNN